MIYGQGHPRSMFCPVGLPGSDMDDTQLKEIIERGLFKGVMKFNEPLSSHTSLGIGGPVDIMVFPEDPLSLKNVLLVAEKENIPLFVIGAGTNLIAPDGRIEGIAVSLKAFRSIELTQDSDENNVVLFAGSGVPLPMLVNYARKYGYSGIEALAGIPGYVGGAIYMNAGSFGVEISDVIISVSIMDPHGGIAILDKDNLGFSYRSSGLPEGSVILSANIILRKDDPAEVERRIKEYSGRKKASQPLGEMSAGCVFKNPVGEAAGRLIEAAGCKGMKKGGVEVSSLHANYFINKGGATCRDFVELMEEVKEMVREHSGIVLQPEVKLIRTGTRGQELERLHD
ncbi:MAG: UDP-N-acetylmuramate dehydrogenase [Nitrospiraceae bacterium]|nr:MAG: UDP-N-acetylmuramate dehydrogenase [Nitrospiraceae bacterium]